VSVEGGLLAGLSQDIPAGLTVLIGGRGTGKTSVVEIIRYCTNTGSIASISDNKRTQQALSILGDGSVTVDFETSGAERSITMPGEEDSLAFLGAHRPLVFSQTEIESIGLDSASRLN